LPGVSAAGAVSRMPFSTSNTRISFGIVGEEEPARPRRTDFRIAGPSYFGTMGIRLTRGRLLTSLDTGESMPVALVNERFVQRYLPGAEPLGRRISIGEEIVTIVGVIGNVRHAEIVAQPAPELYVPLAQAPPFTMSFAVRHVGDGGSIGPAVRSAVASIDPGQPVAMMATMESMVDFAMPQRMLMKVLVAFAGVALALAAIGLYGVLAHAVASRTREIGLRMALGAEARTVRREVIGRGLRLTAIGAVIGGAGGLAVARVMRGLFAGVSPFDPLAFLAALLVLFTIALLACWVPGSRASSVDPIVALREE
ncbi:MAG: FtsX-like permease family protein, partial [Thermoanaerobaculia bacterium]